MLFEDLLRLRSSPSARARSNVFCHSFSRLLNGIFTATLLLLLTRQSTPLYPLRQHDSTASVKLKGTDERDTQRRTTVIFIDEDDAIRCRHDCR